MVCGDVFGLGSVPSDVDDLRGTRVADRRVAAFLVEAVFPTRRLALRRAETFFPRAMTPKG